MTALLVICLSLALPSGDLCVVHLVFADLAIQLPAPLLNQVGSFQEGIAFARDQVLDFERGRENRARSSEVDVDGDNAKKSVEPTPVPTDPSG